MMIQVSHDKVMEVVNNDPALTVSLVGLLPQDIERVAAIKVNDHTIFHHAFRPYIDPTEAAEAGVNAATIDWLCQLAQAVDEAEGPLGCDWPDHEFQL